MRLINIVELSGRPKDKLIQFCKDLKDVPASVIAKFKFPMLIAEKYDGVFCMVWKDFQGVMRITSRTGEDYYSMTHIEREFFPLIQEGEIVIFEAYAEDTDQGTISGWARDTKNQHLELKAYCHDHLTFSEFKDGGGRTYSTRYAHLGTLLTSSSTNIFKVSQYQCGSLERAKEVAQSIWDRGGEGAILSDPLATYEGGKRIIAKLKIKQKVTYDLLVTGIKEGLPGKFSGMVGTIQCRFKEGREITMSGMKKAQRIAWWADPSLIIGKIVEVEAMKDSTKGKLRELAFKGIREDKLKGDF